MDLQALTITMDDLRIFHAKHFPHAPLPEQYLYGVEKHTQEECYDDGDDRLSYYDDGVKRTLTDEQIAMFRHSEIQRIVLERRRRDEAGEPIHEPRTEHKGSEVSAALEPDAVRAASPASNESTPMSISSDDDQVKPEPAEKPQQKWTAVSEKTRIRNARNRQKNRKNHRAKKKEERKKERQEMKQTRQKERGSERDGEQDEESDEWDPWHQANGPDAQKEDTVSLDY